LATNFCQDATAARIVTKTPWIGNQDAPNCGCQIIIDPLDQPGWDYISNTCRLSFPYARDWGYGRTMTDASGRQAQNYDPHFVQVSSSFAVGRQYQQFTARDGWSTGDPMFSSEFMFTGYDAASNPNVIDIVVFYHESDCMRHDDDAARADGTAQFPYLNDDLIPSAPSGGDIDPESYRNLTSTQVYGDGDIGGLCSINLVCNEEQVGGVRLGTFNYDLDSAENRQSYSIGIHGLEAGEEQELVMKDYQNEPFYCGATRPHNGHGSAVGCSSAFTGDAESDTCSNIVTFTHDQAHMGLLEYLNVDAVDPVNNPHCMSIPTGQNEPIEWQTPSHWDTQNEINQSRNQAGPVPPSF